MSERSPNNPGPERPRAEPEIIPPERAGGGKRGVWVTVNDQNGTRRMYVAQAGPFTVVLVLAILGLVALGALILLLSLAIIWIPIVIAMVIAFMAWMYWRRFRLWLARR